jgi:hypothetical protein
MAQQVHKVLSDYKDPLVLMVFKVLSGQWAQQVLTELMASMAQQDHKVPSDYKGQQELTVSKDLPVHKDQQVLMG